MTNPTPDDAALPVNPTSGELARNLALVELLAQIAWTRCSSDEHAALTELLGTHDKDGPLVDDIREHLQALAHAAETLRVGMQADTMPGLFWVKARAAWIEHNTNSGTAGGADGLAALADRVVVLYARMRDLIERWRASCVVRPADADGILAQAKEVTDNDLQALANLAGPEEPAALAVGDVVRLRSGGPMMSVTGISDDGFAANCAWHDDNSCLHRSFLPVNVLLVEAKRKP